MNREVRSVLRHIIQRYGRDLVKQPSLCDAYIADFLPMYPKIRRYLVKALQSGIVNQLLPEPDPSKFMALSKQLARLTALEPKEAQTIIQYWAYALSSDPEQLSTTAASPKSLWKPLFASVVGALGIGLLGTWLWSQWQANTASEPDATVTALTNSELMTGAKPVFIEAVDIPRNTATSSIMNPISGASASALALTQATLAMTSNTALAQANASNPTPVANLAEPILPNDIATLSPDQLQRFQQVQRTQQLNQEALNALQSFTDIQQRYAQKQQALQTLNLMWASTQQPYYRQQQQAISNQIQQLQLQLEENLSLYNTALQGLCSVIGGDELLLETINGAPLQTLIRQHVSECQSNQALNVQRDQLIKGLQMLQASR